MNNYCEKLHKIFSTLPRFKFPFDENRIPRNGIYILFEDGEISHTGDRVVRVGTHTGNNQLRSRIKQHFIQENKDRSIFRKNIGRSLLHELGDPFLDVWNLDLTTREAKERYEHLLNYEKQREIEKEVTYRIQEMFSFVVFEVTEKPKRLNYEKKIISTISWCSECKPSKYWFGLQSPKKKIQESGLWLVNGLYKEVITDQEYENLKRMIERGHELNG